MLEMTQAVTFSGVALKTGSIQGWICFPPDASSSEGTDKHAFFCACMCQLFAAEGRMHRFINHLGMNSALLPFPAYPYRLACQENKPSYSNRMCIGEKQCQCRKYI